jgi:hypothetical protein
MHSQTREKVGRNDLCPCGSGKKYKHCCLKEQPPSSDRLWQQQHEASAELNRELMKFAARRFGDRVEDAWQDFNMGDVGQFLDERPQALAHEDQIFMPYFLFHWDPDETPEDEEKNARSGGVVARAYLRERAYDLSPMNRAILDQATTRPLSVYEILWSRPGEGVAVRDILTGAEFEVLERSASQTLRQGDIVYGQTWSFPGLAVFGCSAPHCIPPSRKAEIIRLRNILRTLSGRRRALTSEDLWDKADIIRAEYVAIRDSLYNPPKLCNTDGDPILFHTLTFRVDSAQATFDALAPLAEGRSRDELLEDAELDDKGQVHSANIDWIRLGRNPRMKTWDNTILGHIKIVGTSLIAEVNSAKRAKRLRKEIEARLGGAAMHENTSARTVDDAIIAAKGSASTKPEPRDMAKEEMLNDPEVREQLQAIVQRQTEAWVRQKIPILGGRTPLQAVRDPDGREIVESLLLEWERQEDNQPTKPSLIRPDIGAIRKLLNLTRARRT